MAEIADITPSNAEATDRLLVRRSGAAPYGLDLLANLTPSELLALRDEIIAARGDRSLLGERIGTISNFASPNAGGIVVGRYYDNAFHSANNAANTGSANRVIMGPFYTSAPMRIDQIGVTVHTNNTSSGRCFIYGSGDDGWPDDLLFEGETDLAFNTTGYKSHSIDFTFETGRQYWLGLRHSGAGAILALAAATSVNLGPSSATANTYISSILATIDFTTPLPLNWDFTPTHLNALTPPSIRMRAAAL